MLNYLEGYKGPVEINGKMYSSVKTAIQELNGFDGQMSIVIDKSVVRGDFGGRTAPQTTPQPTTKTPDQIDTTTIYQLKVRKYMTKPATPEFDFHTKWNNGVPMPLRIMVGRKIKETRGMVQMELWGEIVDELTTHCMACGRVLTNPVSKYFGIGPECGGHNYTNPFSTDAELKEAVAKMNEELKNKKWTGWVIKSAIEEITVLRRADE